MGVVDKGASGFRFVYEDAATLWDNVRAVAIKIYGATDITADAKVKAQIQKLKEKRKRKEKNGRYSLFLVGVGGPG